MGIINARFISGLEVMSPDSFSSSMEKYAGRGEVNVVNWSDEYPYAPQCSVLAAHCRMGLALSFRVCGKDLRATALEDNGRSWEDSCVEFFVSSADGKGYYNVEITCIGSILLSFGSGRSDRRPLDSVTRIIRRSSLPREAVDIRGGLHSWSVDVIIPWDVIGYDRENLPSSLKVNFYKCGDLTAHPHFLSWSPIDTPSPDFHRPEFFGEMMLLSEAVSD